MDGKPNLTVVMAVDLIVGVAGMIAFNVAAKSMPITEAYPVLFGIGIGTWIVPIIVVTYVYRKSEAEISNGAKPSTILVQRLVLYIALWAFGLVPFLLGFDWWSRGFDPFLHEEAYILWLGVVMWIAALALIVYSLVAYSKRKTA